MRVRAALPVVALLALLACAGNPPTPCPATASTAGLTPAPSAPASAQRPVLPPVAPADRERLRAYAATRGFRLGSPDAMTPTPDGQAVLFLRSGARDPKQSLFETNLKTDETRLVLSPDALLKGPETLSAAERARRERNRTRTTGFTSFELSLDGSRVLLGLSGRAFVFARATGETHELPTGGAGTELGAVIDPHLSHDGRRVAYVRGHDLYVIDADAKPATRGAEIALTHGGTETLSRGAAEFIAAEELDRSRGFWWSPDDTRLLYEEADTSKVEQLQIVDPAHPERDPTATRYPRAGSPNAKVRFGIVGARGGATTWVALDDGRFPYVAKATWQDGGPPTLYALDRAQRTGALLAVDPGTGKTRELLVERDAAWLDVDPTVPRWLPDGSGFLWSTEREGPARRLELHDKSGALLRVLTRAELGYREVFDLDAKAGVAYVGASAEPADAGVYRVRLDGSAPEAIVAPDGVTATAVLSTSHDVLAIRQASRTGMPSFWAQSTRGGQKHSIPAESEAPTVMPRIELTTVGPDAMRVVIVRPQGFVPGQRYPVIDSAYGGPGHSVATSSALRFVLDQWIADRASAIVVGIDARGTPNRGHDWERALEGKLGSVPLAGHVAALQALGLRYPEMDTTRVGVYGWSFGGYFAAMAVLARPDVYRVGVAAAPPADWRDYDTCYTERYLGLPSENAAAYDAASLLTVAAVSNERVAPHLLVVHGTADDNVYFFHSLKLVGALERAGRPFQFFPVPGMTHVPRDPAVLESVFRTAGDFLGAHL